MNVVDSSCWPEYFAGWPNSAVFWTQDADFSGVAGVRYVAKK